ncbi:unnamed protein product [Amaranthus hypochondriacus]
MSPKPTTAISATLTLLFLTLSLSSTAATTDCPGYDSVSDVLSHYGLPTGLFPANVNHFKCETHDENSIKLSIELTRECTVTRSLFGVKNVLECKSHISAIVSKNKMTNVEGVQVKLYINNQQIGEVMEITEVKVSQLFVFLKTIEFLADNGSSAVFPFEAFPNKPPTCDETDILGFVKKNKNNEHIPTWVFNAYGRPLFFPAI